MRAVTWQGPGRVDVRELPEPRLLHDTDAIVKVSSTAICGSDLHLLGPLSPFMSAGDVLGHEFMGTVVEAGPKVDLSVGDRVVVPFNISCGRCEPCRSGLQSQCEATRDRHTDTGAALFGYSRLYGAVPGGQAEFVRVPYADYGPIVVPGQGSDERWLFLSDVLPTAWQAVHYADLQPGETLAVIGLGPIGQMVARCAFQLGAGRVIGVDGVPARLDAARRVGVEVISAATEPVADRIAELTDGRGADRVVDAVGMEAHGSPGAGAMMKLVTIVPALVARGAIRRWGVDRTAALVTSFASVRRGGTVSLAGVYGGAKDPINLMSLFDRQVTIRMGQANVRRWSAELLALLDQPMDVLGVDDFATHHLRLDDAPHAYDLFATKQDGCIKVVLRP
jgi:threonine dehydrogenase-like Zn-dependent dehydrogenase